MRARGSSLAQRSAVGITDCRSKKRFNWLADLDRRAPKLVRATSWLNYPCFMFARYPRLQPSVGPAPGPTSKHPEAGLETFQSLLTRWGQKIADHEEARRVLDGLSASQRSQLAGLLIDSMGDLEAAKRNADWKIRLTLLAGEAGRRQRMLSRKVSKACEALGDLRRYAQSLERQAELASLRPSEYRRKADICLQELASLPPQTPPEEWRAQREDSRLFLPGPADAATFGMVEFYWFFCHGCRCSGREAEVRTALLRNAFWPPLASKVAYLPEYDGVESKGCPSVKKAVARFRLYREQAAKEPA